MRDNPRRSTRPNLSCRLQAWRGNAATVASSTSRCSEGSGFGSRDSPSARADINVSAAGRTYRFGEVLRRRAPSARPYSPSPQRARAARSRAVSSSPSIPAGSSRWIESAPYRYCRTSTTCASSVSAKIVDEPAGLADVVVRQNRSVGKLDFVGAQAHVRRIDDVARCTQAPPRFFHALQSMAKRLHLLSRRTVNLYGRAALGRRRWNDGLGHRVGRGRARLRRRDRRALCRRRANAAMRSSSAKRSGRPRLRLSTHRVGATRSRRRCDAAIAIEAVSERFEVKRASLRCPRRRAFAECIACDEYVVALRRRARRYRAASRARASACISSTRRLAWQSARGRVRAADQRRRARARVRSCREDRQDAGARRPTRLDSSSIASPALTTFRRLRALERGVASAARTRRAGASRRLSHGTVRADGPHRPRRQPRDNRVDLRAHGSGAIRAGRAPATNGRARICWVERPALDFTITATEKPSASIPRRSTADGDAATPRSASRSSASAASPTSLPSASRAVTLTLQRIENDDLLDELSSEPTIVIDVGDGVDDRGEVIAELDSSLAPQAVFFVDAYATDLGACARTFASSRAAWSDTVVLGSSRSAARRRDRGFRRRSPTTRSNWRKSFSPSLGKGVVLVEDAPGSFWAAPSARSSTRRSSPCRRGRVARRHRHRDAAWRKLSDRPDRVGTRDRRRARRTNLERLARAEGEAFAPHRSLWMLDVAEEPAAARGGRRVNREVWVIDAVRTPIGRYGGAARKRSSRRSRGDRCRAPSSNAPASRRRAIDDVYFGAANQSGEDNRNVARMAALLARFAGRSAGRDDQPALRFEPSGDQLGRASDCLRRRRRHDRRRRRVDDARAVRAAEERRGVRAQATALRYGVGMANDQSRRCPRSGRSRWARRPRTSPNDTASRAKSKTVRIRFADEVQGGEGTRRVRRRNRRRCDVGRTGGERAFRATSIRGRETTLDALAKLKPAFQANGTVTAGNSRASTMARRRCCSARPRRRGDSGLRRWRASWRCASAGVAPDVMGLGPIPATRKALARAGLPSATSISSRSTKPSPRRRSRACANSTSIREKTNVNGGAIALGHPLGASGARIATTLLHELRRRGGRYGLATMCIGVGQGIATIFERVELKAENMRHCLRRRQKTQLLIGANWRDASDGGILRGSQSRDRREDRRRCRSHARGRRRCGRRRAARIRRRTNGRRWRHRGAQRSSTKWRSSSRERAAEIALLEVRDNGKSDRDRQGRAGRDRRTASSSTPARRRRTTARRCRRRCRRISRTPCANRSASSVRSCRGTFRSCSPRGRSRPHWQRDARSC